MGNTSIIWWRDIPTQIISGKGRRAIKVQLDQRFTIAVDRAAMISGATDTNAYLQDWRKSPIELDDDDIELAIKQYAKKLESEYPNSRLGELAKNSGYEISPNQDTSNQAPSNQDSSIRDFSGQTAKKPNTTTEN